MNRHSRKLNRKLPVVEKKSTNNDLKIIQLVVAVLIIYFCFTIYSQQKDMEILKSIYDTSLIELKDKEAELKLVQEDLKKVDSDEFVEKIAREKLKMVKPNEIVYIDTNKKINLKKEEE